jgi:acetyl esterase/lipase
MKVSVLIQPMDVRKYLILLILLLPSYWIACSQDAVRIWSGIKGTYTQQRARLDVYLPEEDGKKHPAVIICPGGSYCYLGICNEGYEVAEWFQQKGVAAFVLHYRTGLLGNHYPTMIQDLQRSIQLVREHADAYAIDSAQVGLMGFSAGGHLAGTAGIYYGENFMSPLDITPSVSLRPAFVAMIYPVVTMHEPLVHHKSRRNLLTRHPSEELIQKMSLEENLHPGVPPVFILACKDDKTVDVGNTQLFVRNLKEKGLPHEAHIFDKGNHGFGLYPAQGTDSEDWINLFWVWMNKVIR